MKIAFLTLYFSLIFISFSSAGVQVRQAEKSWVDSVYETMSDQQRIGQLINIKIKVTNKNLNEYRDMIREYSIGQISLTGGSVRSSGVLINELSQFLNIPLLITSSGNAGIGLPLDSSFRFPGTASLNRVDDPALIRTLAEEVVVQNQRFQVHAYHTGLLNIDLSAFGMTLGGGAFNNYGKLPDWSLAFHKSILDSGMFVQANIRIPGSTSPMAIADNLRNQSILSKINMKRSLEVKDFDKWNFSITQIPFFKLTEAKTVEKVLINGVIRKQLGNKVLISADLDALRSGTAWHKADQIAVSLLLAGADAVLIASEPERVVIQLEKALNAQVLKPRDLELKVKRILRAKYLAGLDKPFEIDTDHLVEGLNSPKAKLVSEQVFQDVASFENGRLSQIPIVELDGRSFASLSFGSRNLDIFQKVLSSYAPFVHFTLPSLSCDPGTIVKMRMRLKAFDVVVVGLHAGDFVEVGQDIVGFVNALSLQTRVALVFFKDIRNESDFSNRSSKIFVHEDHPYAQSLAVQMIFGAFTPHGTDDNLEESCYRLAYGLPEEEQMDSRTLKGIEHIIQEAIREEDMPGCQVLVARNGKIIYNKSFGYYTYDSVEQVEDNSIYDLASITKVAATTQMMMRLSGNGYIDIDKPVGYYLRELKNTNKEHLTIRNILAHQAGLKPFYPFWRYTVVDDKPDSIYYHNIRQSSGDLEVIPGMYAERSLRDSIWHWTVETDLLRKNKEGGYDYHYSDLGFYILQRLIERVTCKSLDVLTDSLFYRPMGMSTMAFKPLCHFPRDRMVPTEHDTYFRQALIWGTVHDPVAAMGGGVAGHAGLFSNAVDLARLIQMILNRGTYGGHKYLEGAVIDEFASKQFKNNRRSLGWDKPESEKGYNPASRYASWKTFGHRGFTGTAVWADPTFQLIYVFLSNRVYNKGEKRKKTKELNVRKRVHDVIYESMWNYNKVYN